MFASMCMYTCLCVDVRVGRGQKCVCAHVFGEGGPVCGPSTISLESCRGDTPRGYRTQCQPVAESLHECNESHACNQNEESQVSAPHGVVSNTPLRVVHKSLSGILIVICPGMLL